jgi:hypothetical protein
MFTDFAEISNFYPEMELRDGQPRLHTKPGGTEKLCSSRKRRIKPE